MQKVAIVGLPNVGKSTLFNRLAKRKSAIVSNVAHVTRDRKEAPVSFCGLQFIAIDTGGIADGDGIQSSVTKQVELALEYADIVFFVVDAKNSADMHNVTIGKWLSKTTSKPVVLVVNKCEGRKEVSSPIDTMEYFGFLGPVYISAEHNLGMTDLYDVVAPLIDGKQPRKRSPNRPIAISIIGQPNVGKSTFLNSVLGEKRVITDAVAGTTRDAISTEYAYKGIKLIITDTAGIRRRAKITEDMEKLSVQSAMSALSQSNVVVLMVDFTQGISHQDLAIASAALENGKGIVVALNKSDLIDDKTAVDAILNEIRQHSRVDFDVPILKISALKNVGCDKVLDRAIKLYEAASTHISTSQLNKWLGATIDYHPPHLQNNKRKVRLKYISQVSTLPPTFVIHTNTSDIEKTYKSYLKNRFLEHFSMQGVPIRMIFKKSTNPYSTTVAARK